MRNSALLLLAVVVTVAGCATPSRMMPSNSLGEPPPFRIVSAGTAPLEIAVTEVVVPNGAGSWIKDAAWLEYTVELSNKSGEPLIVDELALRTERHPGRLHRTDREQLTEDSAENLKFAGRAMGGFFLGDSSPDGSRLPGPSMGLLAASSMMFSVVNPYSVGITVVDATRRLIYESKDRDAIQARLESGLQVPLTIQPGGTARGKLFFALTDFPHDLAARFRMANESIEPRHAAARLADFSRQGCGSVFLRDRSLASELPPEVRGATRRGASIEISKLVLRNGPGSWAGNAAWDEYELKIVNPRNEPLVVHEVALTDSLARRFTSQHAICPQMQNDLKKSKQVAPSAIPALGVLSLAYNGMVSLAAREAADDIATAIDQRRSRFPFVVAPGGEAWLSMMYPISPAARQLSVEINDSGGRETVVLELAALGGRL
jgi:hypothetical protein